MSYWTDNIGGSVIRQRVHLEDHGRHNAVIESTQDCTPVVEENKRLRHLAEATGTTQSRHGTVVAARIPSIHYYIIWPQEFQTKHGYHPRRLGPGVNRREAEQAWRDFVARKLNDSDFRDFRTDNPKRKLPRKDHGAMW